MGSGLGINTPGRKGGGIQQKEDSSCDVTTGANPRGILKTDDSTELSLRG